MKSCRLIPALAALVLVVSCGPKTVISGTLKDSPDAKVIVKLLNVNRYQVLDTVKTDAHGSFRYTPEIEAGKPEFIYLFHGDRRIASLLLHQGDRVSVNADTLGNYSVEGSEESLQLQGVEKEYARFLVDMDRLATGDDPASVNKALSRRYVEYYRDRVTYVLSHTKSLTSVPVLFQQVSDGFPVFNQSTDGLLFSAVADSLSKVYPESRYVKALSQEAARRQNAMEIGMRLEKAESIGFLDIDLPTPDARNVKLSEIPAKVTMLYFWSTTAEQKMFNMDALIPIYKEYHDRGFEIYAVALDADKTAWATAVRNQQLPWINVCDTRGASSPYVGLYGVSNLPMAWFLVNGEIDSDATVSDAASIRKYLNNKLK